MAPKIYHLHPLVAGPLDEWGRHLARIRAMGFDHAGTAPLFAPGAAGDIFLTADHEALNPALGAEPDADAVIARLAASCAAQELHLVLDIVLDRVALESGLRASQPSWFEAEEASPDPPDPRRRPPARDAAEARFANPDAADALGAWWVERLARLTQAGVAGFRCLHPDRVPPKVWRRVIAAVRAINPDTLFIAWTPGVARGSVVALAGLGFDRVASSLAWWDGRASWLVEEAATLHAVAPALATPEPSFAERLAPRLDPRADLGIAYRRSLKLAAALGAGMLVPMGFEYATRRAFDAARASPADFERARQESVLDMTGAVREANLLVDRIAPHWPNGELRALTGPDAAVTALLRADAPDIRAARHALLILVNPDLTRDSALDTTMTPLPPAAGAAFGHPSAMNGLLDLTSPLTPGEVRLAGMERLDGVTSRAHPDVAKAAHAPRLAIEAIEPAVDGGAFPVKRVAGEAVRVAADILLDGHEVLGAEVLWRCADEAGWRRVPMRQIDNDRWEGVFTPERVGRHIFAVQAWWDEWATFRRDLIRKRDAGQDLTLEAEEGRRLLHRIGMPTVDGVAALLADDTDSAAAAVEHRPFLTRSAELTLDADRAQAAFASWYEMFPRSAGGLAGVEAELPRIRAMGFDVLYFPPIHPIGHTNRKGRNNAEKAAPSDIGSPYAIGAEQGGHDAIDPDLGTFADFRHLLDAAQRHGMEIALDFAIQCSLDHPWIKAHPAWFRWRPDGSIQYAENPPKKYQDIVNVEFHASTAIPDLWLALRDVVLFWLDHGVRIFRVDNPHTKPLPFWRWLIEDVRARDPGVIFLAEAFTRPKMMYRLAKIGFTQSYTYFTWRDTKADIGAYLTELDAPPVRDFFRPNFFVNTPDINPYFLQTSGRPGFLIRAALAATLSGLWGMYSGFELCEGTPLPGREEYLDSEKYQLRTRDWNAPGNIGAEIAALNRIRRANPALHSHLGVRFYNAFNDQVLLYGKRHGRGLVLVAVSFDPHNAQEAAIEVPVWEWGLPDDGVVAVDDLMRDTRFSWHGKTQRIRLDPADLPFAIWRVMPA
ncbi:MAG: maltotransferase domain-containing protein [Acetobacteraceae bacterium]